VTSFNLAGYMPLHTAVFHGQRKALEALMSFHTNRHERTIGPNPSRVPAASHNPRDLTTTSQGFNNRPLGIDTGLGEGRSVR